MLVQQAVYSLTLSSDPEKTVFLTLLVICLEIPAIAVVG